jgi:hypothetical protein
MTANEEGTEAAADPPSESDLWRVEEAVTELPPTEMTTREGEQTTITQNPGRTDRELNFSWRPELGGDLSTAHSVTMERGAKGVSYTLRVIPAQSEGGAEPLRPTNTVPIDTTDHSIIASDNPPSYGQSVRDMRQEKILENMLNAYLGFETLSAPDRAALKSAARTLGLECMETAMERKSSMWKLGYDWVLSGLDEVFRREEHMRAVVQRFVASVRGRLDGSRESPQGVPVGSSTGKYRPDLLPQSRGKARIGSSSASHCFRSPTPLILPAATAVATLVGCMYVGGKLDSVLDNMAPLVERVASTCSTAMGAAGSGSEWMEKLSGNAAGIWSGVQSGLTRGIGALTEYYP